MPQDNMYMQKKMLAAIEQMPPLRQFLHKTFFKKTVTHTTETIEMDIRYGRREIASFVNPLSDAKTVTKRGYKTITTRPAYTKEKMQITPPDTQKKVFGDNPYVRKSPQQIADEMLGENLRTLNDRVSRLEEKICAEALFTGKVEVEGLGWEVDVDFGYETGTEYTSNIRVLSGVDTWDHPDSKPLQDLDNWRRDIRRRSGYQPDVVVMAWDVGHVFLENPSIQKYLDIRRFEIGHVEPELLPEGVSYIGKFKLLSGVVEVYVYDEWYFDSTDKKEKPIVPSGRVLIGSSKAENQFHYGMIHNMHCLDSVPRWPWVFTDLDGRSTWAQLESSPMANIFEPNTIVVGIVLGQA